MADGFQQASGDPTPLELSQSTVIDRASAPRSVVDALREMAVDLRALQSGAFPPSGTLLKVVASALETAAKELARQSEITERSLRCDRTSLAEAKLLHSVLEDLSQTHVRVQEIERALERAEQRGEERARNPEHRGMDWAAVRMANRVQP